MDDSFIVFAWTLAGTAAFAVVGGLFGGLAGWLSWRSGSACGTRLGRKVADALCRLSEEDLSETRRGALIGIVDGALFLGVFGMLIGLLAGWRGEAPAVWLVPLFRATLALAGGAVIFGLLALGIIRLRLRAIVAGSMGGVGGGLLAAQQVGVAHIVPGAVLGLILGTLLAALMPKM